MIVALKIILVIVALAALKRLYDSLTNPGIKAAYKASSQLNRARQIAKGLPEGQLLQVADSNISQIGESMLLEGVPTKEINLFMIDMLAEKNALNSSQFYPNTLQTVVGNPKE
jgi:hypothetical protein